MMARTQTMCCVGVAAIFLSTADQDCPWLQVCQITSGDVKKNVSLWPKPKINL
jgi:hypothetical protein